MLSAKKQADYYQALINRDSSYQGIFYVGVKSTGIFCHPTCSSRKPKFEQCEFFESAKQALLASYRPCKRCKPLSYPNKQSTLIDKLIKSVENEPEKRWKEKDFKELGLDASTARRQFKKRFGMTFVEYARARRMGLALGKIKGGNKVIDTQLSSGYESSSGFRDAFTRILGKPPTLSKNCHSLKATWIDTCLGPMLAISNEEALYLLEFIDRRGLEREIERLRIRMKSGIVPGLTKPIQKIEKELALYFEGKLKGFSTPIHYLGSPFQARVWDELNKIPYGETISYVELAKKIGNPSACRAVARANGANQLAIMIPCHRVINKDGRLGGYGGGLSRKEWLLNHEKNNA